MNGVELLEQVYIRRETGEATACQTCVTKCLSDKLDSGDKATDQDQAICFSECGCSDESAISNPKDFTHRKPLIKTKQIGQTPPENTSVSFELDDDGMNLWWDSRPSDRERTRKLRNAGVTNYPSKGAPDHGFIQRFDDLPEDVKQKLRKSVSGEVATEQDIISKCKTCGFTGGMKDIIKHSDDTGHDDIELMGATKEIDLIEEVSESDRSDVRRKWNGGNGHTRDKMLKRTGNRGPDLIGNTFEELPPPVQEDLIEFDIAGENCGCKFNKFCGESVQRLEKTHGKEVAFMFGKIEGIEGMKIKGKLAYAGVSHNNRLYLPEALQKGDRMELPMIFNHASPDGAEFELSRLPTQIRESILNHEHIRVGDVKLFWDAENLTLFYEGEVNDEFFAKEIDQGLMSVSLGMLFDADSPEICDQECYTVVKGAEFTEVSLVYHPGFPIATIESNEIRLKKRITPRRYKL